MLDIDAPRMILTALQLCRNDKLSPGARLDVIALLLRMALAENVGVHDTCAAFGAALAEMRAA
jgi:hypothetical protein